MVRELRRQPRWLFWVLPVAPGSTFASTLMSSPDQGLGAPVLHFVVLYVSGLVLVLWIALILLRCLAGAEGSQSGEPQQPPDDAHCG